MPAAIMSVVHYTVFHYWLLAKLERNNIGAECRHDTRPSVQLTSVSSVGLLRFAVALWQATR